MKVFKVLVIACLPSKNRNRLLIIKQNQLCIKFSGGLAIINSHTNFLINMESAGKLQLIVMVWIKSGFRPDTDGTCWEKTPDCRDGKSEPEYSQLAVEHRKFYIVSLAFYIAPLMVSRQKIWRRLRRHFCAHSISERFCSAASAGRMRAISRPRATNRTSFSCCSILIS